MTPRMREQITKERKAGIEAVGRLTATVDDLAELVRRLAHSLRQAAPENDLPEKALDYLRRKGLEGSPLRKVSNSEVRGCPISKLEQGE